MTHQEYNTKRDEVMAKFRKEFAENYYRYDPTFHAIVESIVRGADPYAVIEQLIEDRKVLQNRLLEFALV